MTTATPERQWAADPGYIATPLSDSIRAGARTSGSWSDKLGEAVDLAWLGFGVYAERMAHVMFEQHYDDTLLARSSYEYGDGSTADVLRQGLFKLHYGMMSGYQSEMKWLRRMVEDGDVELLDVLALIDDDQVREIVETFMSFERMDEYGWSWPLNSRERICRWLIDTPRGRGFQQAARRRLWAWGKMGNWWSNPAPRTMDARRVRASAKPLGSMPARLEHVV
jgi:hypothetical protein